MSDKERIELLIIALVQIQLSSTDDLAVSIAKAVLREFAPSLEE